MDQLATWPLGIVDEDVERRRSKRRGVVALLLGLSLTTLGAGATTLAVFTDSDSSSGSWSTASIDIESNPVTVFSATDIVPGYTETQPITVQNNGTSQFRYALSTAATNALGDQLTVEIRAQGTSCAAFDGAVVLATTALDGAGFGSSAQGANAGDRVLAGGASEVLCFRVSFPLTSNDTYQGTSSTATFTFDAEQTANNP